MSKATQIEYSAGQNRKETQKRRKKKSLLSKIETQAKKEGIWVTTEEAESKTSKVNNMKKKTNNKKSNTFPLKTSKV